MNARLQVLQVWMDADEGEHLEFKEAKANFHFEKLVKYCAALANEGGGRIILGVSDKKPRKVVGSQAFTDLARTKAGIIERLRLRIEAEEISHPNGRVVVVHVPPRPLGMPVSVEGAYWMRSGEDLAPMTPDILAALTPSERDSWPCKWMVLADLDLRTKGGQSCYVGLYSLRDEPVGAFSAGPSFEERVYYRGTVDNLIVRWLGRTPSL